MADTSASWKIAWFNTISKPEENTARLRQVKNRWQSFPLLLLSSCTPWSTSKLGSQWACWLAEMTALRANSSPGWPCSQPRFSMAIHLQGRLGQSQGLSLGHLERHLPPDARGGDGRAEAGGSGQARRAPGCSAHCSFQVTETCPKRLLTCLKQKRSICSRTIWPLVVSAGFHSTLRSVQQYQTRHFSIFVFGSVKDNTKSKCKSKLSVLAWVTFKRAGGKG